MTPILPHLNLHFQGDAYAWALTSHDDAYRYLLGRSWSPVLPTWTFCMLNPSKARHDVTDQTLGKVVGFARRGGAGSIVICNLFAFSATKQRDLVARWQAGNDSSVLGEHNATAMRWAIGRVLEAPPAVARGRLISAWGRIPRALAPVAEVSRRVWETLARAPTDCLGTNADGSPRHPLMLGYDTPIVPFGVSHLTSSGSFGTAGDGPW